MYIIILKYRIYRYDTNFFIVEALLPDISEEVRTTALSGRGAVVSTVSLVYLIMAGVEGAQTVRKGKGPCLHQQAEGDVNLEMSLPLYILNASFVKQYRCPLNTTVAFRCVLRTIHML